MIVTTHMKIPNATHSWKLVTKPPRIDAGLISALNTGIVEILTPMPRLGLVKVLLKYLGLLSCSHARTKTHEEAAN